MIVIPDVHGRTFWKEAVKGRENEEIVFLGDYLDPYDWEGIKSGDALDNFQDIIWFKEDHPNNVTLLIGNHDLHYVEDEFASGGRMMIKYFWGIQEEFIENKDLFQLAYEKKIGDKMFLFTHAGVRVSWLDAHKDLNLPNGEGLAEALNNAFRQEDRRKLVKALSDVSKYRGGTKRAGSPLWADVDEHLMDGYYKDIPNFYQVFGHSQQEKDPIITDNIACLDCRKAFEINDNGEIQPIGAKESDYNTDEMVDKAVNQVLNNGEGQK